VSTNRRSGVLTPLFSLPSRRSWGVGEFADVPIFARWAATAGQSFIQVLPITEIPDSDTSPYSALTAMALDPIYISLPELEDFEGLGGEERLGDADRATLDTVRSSSRIQYALVRPFKARWLRRAHEWFVANEVGPQTDRAARFDQFVRDEAWWLEDYALFQALRGLNVLKPWWDWPEPLARRHDHAIERAKRELSGEIAYRKYVQWVAAEQWARARAASAPVAILGDLPFMISADSPDVWTQQDEFIFDATVGVPPDAFSETGQDWGLPPCRWGVMATNDFEWIRKRARRSAALFDGFRLDHLVGLYRTYIRPLDKSIKPYFSPAEEAEQLTLGENVVGIYQATGAELIAEDLGTVPTFVRQSLTRLAVPGFKVLRWERQWGQPDQPYLDPVSFDAVSVATTGTHDTETLASWWDALSPEERDQVLAIPSLAGLLDGSDREAARLEFTRPLNDALLQVLLRAGSTLAILPIQDLFGWRDRINTPATVGEENWSWRLPWPVEALDELEEPRARAIQLHDWTRASNRGS
jgi:4-alpha-glucanotransferase